MVISRASQEHLNEMRDVLIEHGAEYGAEKRRRYQSRCGSDDYDPSYLRDFHRSVTYTCLKSICDVTAKRVCLVAAVALVGQG